jgi:tRNA pseudouridine55 synthase
MKNSARANPMIDFEGILPVDKPIGKTSFSLVALLRKITGIKKIGHAGTLDPFARGVMVLLIGKPFTRLSNRFLMHDKEYAARIHLGVTTDTYDRDGEILSESSLVPTLEEVKKALENFQGTTLQIPPMFSAKKVNGKKLYELARKGISIEREAVSLTLFCELINYEYPYVDLHVTCSKGTYIRSLAHDLGSLLHSGAHLEELTRTRSGPFHLRDCIDGQNLEERDLIKMHLRKETCFEGISSGPQVSLRAPL